MKVDRILFLALASSLAATACSASGDEPADDTEGALVGECMDPGSPSPISQATVDTTCNALVAKGEAVGEHGPSLKSVCSGYLTNFKANAAAQAKACIDGITTNSPSQYGPSLDWEQLYGCGFDTLAQSCDADGAERECADLVRGLKPSQKYTHEGKTDDESLKAECVGFFSGLNGAARANVKKCASPTQSYPLPIYSCVEGIDPNARNMCTPVKAPAGARRGDVKFACYYLPGPQMEGICLTMTGAARVGPGQKMAEAMKKVGELSNPNDPKALQKVYNAGIAELRATCTDPEAVDAPCAELVKKYTAAGKSNAGGRITRECRSLFPGLLKASRDKILRAPVPADGRVATAILAVPMPCAYDAQQPNCTTDSLLGE